MAKYQIQINKPCSEDWYKMTDQDKGKFCESCQKTVHDFTHFSKTELARKIKKGDNFCGRFISEQLMSDLELPQKSYLPKFSFSLSVLGFLGLSTPVFSQINEKEQIIIRKNQSNNYTHNSSKNKKVIIRGKVSDKTGVLPGAAILFKGTSEGTESDFNGRFELTVDQKYFKKNKLNLIISYLGYKDKSIIIDKKNLDKIVGVILEEDDDSFLMGEVVIIEKKEPTLFSFIGNLFKKKKNNTNCKNKSHNHKIN